MEVLIVLMSIQGSQMEKDDPNGSYMQQVWAHNFKDLGHHL